MTRNMTCGIASAGRLPGGASLGSPQRNHAGLSTSPWGLRKYNLQLGSFSAHRTHLPAAALTGPLTAWAAAGSCPIAARLPQVQAGVPPSAMLQPGCVPRTKSLLLRCWRHTDLHAYTGLSCSRPLGPCGVRPSAAWGLPKAHAPSRAAGSVGAVALPLGHTSPLGHRGIAVPAATAASTHHVTLGSGAGIAAVPSVGTPSARDVAVGAGPRAGRGGQGTSRTPSSPQAGRGRQQRPPPQRQQQQQQQMKPNGLQEQKQNPEQYTGREGSGSSEGQLAGRSTGGSAGVAAGGLGHLGRTGQLGSSVSTGDTSSAGAQLQTPGASRTLGSRSGAGSSSSSGVEGALPPLLRLLLRVVRPLDEAGYAYCAVGPTAAWLQGAQLLPPRPLQQLQQQEPDLLEQEEQGGDQGQQQEGQQGQQEQEQAQAMAELCVEVQWDNMPAVHAMFCRPGSGWRVGPLCELPGGRAAFVMTTALPSSRSTSTTTAAAAASGAGVAGASGGQEAAPAFVAVRVSCTYNTVLRAQPWRVLLTPTIAHNTQLDHPKGMSTQHSRDQQLRGSGDPGDASGSGAGTLGLNPRPGMPQVWAQSLYGVAVEAERAGDRPLAGAAAAALRELQRALAAHNCAAWGRDQAYDAWVARWGPPEEAAGRLLRDPARALGPLLPYLQLPGSPPLAGLHVANLLGSHGHKAVALAAMGAARAVVVDASAGNAAYARQLAAAAAEAMAAAAAGTGSATAAAGSAAAAAEAGSAAAEAGTAAGSAVAAGAGKHCAGGEGGGPGSARHAGTAVEGASAAAAAAAADPISIGGCSFEYVVCDVLSLKETEQERHQRQQQQQDGGAGPEPALSPSCPLAGRAVFDVVLLEMGVLHYFVDLRELFGGVVLPLLRPGGRVILREFHPVSTKLITTKGKKHKVTGDYFSTQLAASDVAYTKYENAAAAAVEAASDDDPGGSARYGGGGGGGGGGGAPVLLRRWGLGEVVSAVCVSGLRVVLLDEEPGVRPDDAGLPKVFTLVAERPVRQ